ncbi:hypothetical protein [Sphingobacterium haloxyli]|uniref:Uncharacterized protein n=1 Tax=Sphingobacterium haloxyli TaxID=2100533 RepID=A0A2S9J1Z3_9SPHI|nr:hypothetical protein [Sphingobacterium haloxyli]PRD46770.1 hypothetical protein C5745_14310 [Sphingobacterium haloxyli]
MTSRLYNPFVAFNFDNQTCFLTGEKLRSPEEQTQVFPIWMMRAFELEEKPFKMLDENIVTYKALKLPCSVGVAQAFEQVESEVESAMKVGYKAVKDLDEKMLFQWIGKVLYGVVFNEIQVGIRQAVHSGEEMNFSQALVHKFRNLHFMLQSLVVPMEFEHVNPFNVQVFPVDNAPDTFLYRDEINTLVFSLRMRDFAVIATLQDNGTNAIYHEEILNHVKGRVLHPVQFEEICARYFYSAYLFNRLPDYTFMETSEKIYIEPMALNDWTLKPIFDNWQTKTYGQVLENFWKPWGYTLFEIIKNPEQPMTFLFDNENKFPEILDLGKA